MEAHLEKSLREIMNQPDVKGAMCLDNQGLCLLAKGDADQNAAGYFSEIARCANMISGSGKDDLPIIALEFSQRLILIKRGGSVTTIIYKEKK